jgi:hypothetical protein
MLLILSIASAMLLSTLFAFWRPSNILILFWVNVFVLSIITISTSATARMIWRLNHPRGKGFKVILLGRVYDITKRVAQLWLPAMGTLYFALSQIWGLPAAEQVIGTIAAVNVFLGVVLAASTKTYNQNDVRFDGHAVIETDDDGASGLRLKSIDQKAVETKDQLTLKLTR